MFLVFGQAAAVPTFTATLPPPVPMPGPVQEMLKVVETSAVQEKEPEVPEPPGPPVTVQLEALDDVQLMLTESPGLALIGPLDPLAFMFAFGAGYGVGVAGGGVVVVNERTEP